MKMPNNSDENESMENQTEPKLRNINEEKETPKEKPKGADIRLKVLAAAILLLFLFVAVKSSFTKASLMSQMNDKQKILKETEEIASKYGIKKDKDGNIIVPDVETTTASGSAVEAGDASTLDSFVKLLLNWNGQSGYEKVRQTLINEWSFSKDCKLLTSFMPEITDESDVSMVLSEYDTFVVSETDEGNAYFLVCTVKSNINSSPFANIGLQIKINKEGTITNVTAQTLS